QDSSVRIVYAWREDLATRARAALIPREDHPRFRAYSERLADIVGTGTTRNSIPLSEVLPPMFALAKQRSVAGNAADENAAALITLALFSVGRDLSAIIPAAADWRAAPPVTLTLYGR